MLDFWERWKYQILTAAVVGAYVVIAYSYAYTAYNAKTIFGKTRGIQWASEQPSVSSLR